MGLAYATYGNAGRVRSKRFVGTLDDVPRAARRRSPFDSRRKPAAGAMVIVTSTAWRASTGSVRTPTRAAKVSPELCTRAAGNAGFDLGARIAGLQASVMGEPVYRRMGYVEVTRYPDLRAWSLLVPRPRSWWCA